tara:strand:- start:27411 stop:28556 length:1146 start_codon:yes stop_codon:yes gene_type:complete
MQKRTIILQAGNGGDGIVSFKRSYKVPKGGPDGGNGGNGGNIYVKFLNKVADFNKSIGSYVKAQNGQKGDTNNKNGKAGQHLVINIPKNYSLWLVEKNTKTQIVQTGKKPALLARGGKGGWGNTKFVLPNRKTPRFSQNGQKGETVAVEVLPKGSADVVIIGEPNSGKTTLLNMLSGSKARTGSYSGTTQAVNYGTFEDGKTLLVLADIPASQTKSNNEHISAASIVLCVVQNETLFPKYTKVCKKNQKIIKITTDINNNFLMSTKGSTNSPEVVEQIKEEFRSHAADPPNRKTETSPTPVTRTPTLKKSKFSVKKEGNSFVLEGSTPGLLAETLDLSNSEARYEFFRRMRLLGVNRDLLKLEAKTGDIVFVGGKEVSWDF